ncbi:unnamed protein product, partial [marine sediment metagenome]
AESAGNLWALTITRPQVNKGAGKSLVRVKKLKLIPPALVVLVAWRKEYPGRTSILGVVFTNIVQCSLVLITYPAQASKVYPPLSAIRECHRDQGVILTRGVNIGNRKGMAKNALSATVSTVFNTSGDIVYHKA